MSLLEDVLLRLFPPRPQPVAAMRRGERVLARGRVVPRDLIASPLSGKSGVYYRHYVEELRPSAAGVLGGGGIWICIARDEAIAEFYLDDGTGRALVLPERAEVIAAGPGVAVDVPSGQRAREVVLPAGALVEVHGVVGEIDDLLDENRGYRERAVRAVLCAPEDDTLRIRIVRD